MTTPLERRNERTNIINMLEKIQTDVDEKMHEFDSRLLDVPSATMIGLLGAAISAVALGLQHVIEMDQVEHK